MNQHRGLLTLVTVGLLIAISARAQTPQDWIKRILNPSSIGVTAPPGATENRKLTVDYLSKTDPPLQMIIYMAPLDQLKAVSDHFAKALGIEPTVTGSGEFEIHKFTCGAGGGCPATAEGLTVTITRSQFVDNKLQVTLEYLPKK